MNFRAIAVRTETIPTVTEAQARVMSDVGEGLLSGDGED